MTLSRSYRRSRLRWLQPMTYAQVSPRATKYRFQLFCQKRHLDSVRQKSPQAHIICSARIMVSHNTMADRKGGTAHESWNGNRNHRVQEVDW